jgi:hypothetical protein
MRKGWLPSKTPMFAAIPVTCPAATGQTCTFHIFLDTKTLTTFGCQSAGCFRPGPTAFYQFLVDSVAPTIGPTSANGDYIIGKNVFTVSQSSGETRQSRQSYPASVVARVTNSSSNSHVIAVSVGCSDTYKFSGCQATATTMRVDVFEP